MDKNQQKCIDLIMQGQNVFITGSAGTGKSYTINKVYELLKYEKIISICALTGCAAILLNSNARTLHSWAGIGLGKDELDVLFNKIKKNKNAWKRWQKTELLVIDEISMLGPILFEKLNELGKRIRRNKKPFGGIQLVLVGDFFQLPPVEEEKFLFESEIFNICIDEIVELTTIYRQQCDLLWYNILQNIRKGKINNDDLKILYSRLITFNENNDESKMCILYPINRKVDYLNQYELEHLNTPIKEFNCRISKDDSVNEYDVDNFMTQMGIPNTLKLAIGAHIILTWNIDITNGLVNGSQGIIINFDDNNNPIIKFINKKKPLTIIPFEYTNDLENEKISIFQLPLKLAWALSIHKVQGHNLDCALMDLGCNIFECGQIYVALSRIKSLKGVFLSSFDPEKIKTNKNVIEFYNKIN